MKIHLNGFRQDKIGTFSDVVAGGIVLGKSVEPPWRDNKPFISCVPEGEYELIPFNSPKYGRVYLLHNPDLNVYAHKDQCKNDSDRYLCIFAHRGSYPSDFQGCIGLGDDYSRVMGMVKNTRATCDAMMELLYSYDEPHTLHITRPT